MAASSNPERDSGEGSSQRRYFIDLGLAATVEGMQARFQRMQPWRLPLRRRNRIRQSDRVLKEELSVTGV